jgi:hypothetical protein
LVDLAVATSCPYRSVTLTNNSLEIAIRQPTITVSQRDRSPSQVTASWV